MKILIFAEGTVLKPAGAGDVNNFASYEPAGAAAAKITAWSERGAEISYLTSRIKFLEIKQIKDVLEKFGFPAADQVHARTAGETYMDIVNKLKPDVLVEDNYASAGGADVITPKLKPDSGVHGIVVPEYGGIDHLPSDLEELKEYGKREEVAAAKEDTY